MAISGRSLNKAACDHVVYAPIDLYLRLRAWRNTVSVVAQGPLWA